MSSGGAKKSTAKSRPAGPESSAGGTDGGAAAASKADAPAAAGAERRQHARVQTAIPFRIVNTSGREESFRLVDLSECGARIQVRTAIPPMTRIQVALVLPGRRIGLTKDVRVETSGVVVWCHPTEDAFDTGVFFSDLTTEHRGLLRGLVHAAS